MVELKNIKIANMTGINVNKKNQYDQYYQCFRILDSSIQLCMSLEHSPNRFMCRFK